MPDDSMPEKKNESFNKFSLKVIDLKTESYLDLLSA